MDSSKVGTIYVLTSSTYRIALRDHPHQEKDLANLENCRKVLLDERKMM